MTAFRTLLLASMLILCLPAGAQAAMQVIPGDGTSNTQKLSIFVGDNGQLQAKQGGPADPVEGMFFGDDAGPASNYWHLRIKGAPATNETFGPNSSGVVPISNGPVTGNFTPSSPAEIETVMHVQHAGVSLFEVKQTVLYVGFDLRYRVIWEVRNIDPQNRTIPFIFGTSADLYIDSSDAGRGVFIDGPSRFVGGTNEQSRTTGGLQEVTSSRLPGEANPTAIPNWASYEEGRYSTVTNRLNGQDAFANTIDPNLIDNGVGVSFDDRATAGLAPNATARYEVVWHLQRPTPLSASPASATKELPGSHSVTFSLVDANFNPVPNATLRYRRTGVNATTSDQTVATDAQGQAVVSWDGTAAGLDTLTGFVDADGDSVQDPEEPAASATVRWLEDNHVDGPPTVTDPPGVPATVQPNPANPEAPTYQFGRSASSGFPDCSFDQRQGRELNLAVSSTLQPGAGTISGVELYLLDASRHNPTDLSTSLPSSALADGTPDQSGNTYSFTVPCVVNGDMWLEFTLTEGTDSQTFRVPIGGLQLIDPQGVVYDGAAYDRAIAGGQTPQQARSAAAIRGATVRLQRQVSGGAFQNVLSGDPGITPNVNPQVTGATGIYQWDVAPGAYRVTVTADGCRQEIAGPVDIPPPVLDLHVRMDCGAVGGLPGGDSLLPTECLGSATAGVSCLVRDGVTYFRGTAGDDRIVCAPGRNVLHAGAGDDRIDCRDERSQGARSIASAAGAGAAQAEPAGDTIIGGPGSDLIQAGDDPDLLVGGPDADRILGGGGADRTLGGEGDDRVSGGAGPDRVSGAGGADRLSGNAGDDRLSGNAGRDRLWGRAGDDVLWGRAGADGLSGGRGDDRLVGGPARDRLRGGTGTNRLLQ